MCKQPIFLLRCIIFITSVVIWFDPGALGQAVDRDAIRESLSRASSFMTDRVARHGGYVWVSDDIGQLGHGEGLTGPDRIWIQPPGTPAVGLAFLESYAATNDKVHLSAALDVGMALAKVQMRSGGWGYSGSFGSDRDDQHIYRLEHLGETVPIEPRPGGWDVWRRRMHKNDKTIIDDDTTPAAIRFLVSLDRACDFKNELIHEVAEYALRSTTNAQYPIGAWSHNYDHFPIENPDENHYPIRPASIPKQWSRMWTKDFTGCYSINDRNSLNMIKTMVLAYEVYKDERYLRAAHRGGSFLLLAQLPEPQPAWAQQYDRHMQPVWDRSFEPPAITGWESQDVIETLLNLTEKTGERRYLDAVERALAYLRKCQLPDGVMARFYELGTNKPIYFSKDYKMTYDSSETPDHYGFVAESRLDHLEARFNAVKAGKQSKQVHSISDQKIQVTAILKAQSSNGGWYEPGFVRDKNGRKVRPKMGVISSATFIANVHALCSALSK